MLNGRLTPKMNDYTFISTRGLSVVDYVLVPQYVLTRCKYFKVESMSDILNKFNLQKLLSMTCKQPDHSLLSFCFLPSVNCNTQSIEANELQCKQPSIEEQSNYCPRKFYFTRMKEKFMSNPEWADKIDMAITNLESKVTSQNHLNSLYDSLCSIIQTEMKEYIPYRGNNQKLNKKFKYSKPYWNEELTKLWKDMSAKEKVFRKFRGHRCIRQSLKKQFEQSRTLFDRVLKKTECKYQKEKVDGIENLCQNNPVEFWRTLKKLGSKSKGIPLKVYKDNILTENLTSVLETWKKEFQNLYNPHLTNKDIDSNFADEIELKRIRMEGYSTETVFGENSILNKPITNDEVKKMCMKLKSKKTPGLDGIPNEVLKSDKLNIALQKLFAFCFENGMVPDTWCKAIIKPIPKGGDKDPYIPLHYRGISLLSCVGKLYSSILSDRINAYLDYLGILVEEQNGFRSKRSCQDHIFSLSTLIQSRKSKKLDTFTAFIDMSKAFDSVNRKLLFYKLLNYNIEGKIYNAIKALYVQTFSCVEINGHFTDWFQTFVGVRQGDNLSPTLFNIFLNDLAYEIQSLNLGVKFGNLKVSMLLYADDIVLIAGSESNLQKMLDHVSEWCKKWQLRINPNKTQIVHFRGKQRRKTTYMCITFNAVKIKLT